MRKFSQYTMVGLVPVVLAFLGGCAPGEPEPSLDLEATKAELKASETPDEDREAMLTVLGLDQATADALNAAYDARDADVGAWLEGEKGARLVELEAQMKAGAADGDLSDIRTVIAEAKPLREELRRLFADHQNAILQTLSPELQLHWHGYEVSRGMLDLMTPLGLTPEQSSAIEQGAVGAVTQATQRGESNPKAAAFLELEKWAEQNVLNPAQREGYQDIKSENKMRSLGV